MALNPFEREFHFLGIRNDGYHLDRERHVAFSSPDASFYHFFCVFYVNLKIIRRWF